MAEYYDPETYPKQWNYLQVGTVVDDYIIEREIGRGGFSSVYLARHKDTQEQVALKEFLPRKLAHRTWNNEVVANDEDSKRLIAHGRSLFLAEAKVLAKLKHPNIVDVINFFQANSTVYLVMVYGYGVTLDRLLKNKNQYKQIKINEQWLLKVFSGLLDGLSLVHQQNFLHLDIKPANLLLRPDNKVLLLDFGAVQSYPLVKAKNKAYILTKGFSPLEQYAATGVLGPYSDIYAVGASMRACLDLSAPLEAPNRIGSTSYRLAQEAYGGKYNMQLLEIIDWAMSIKSAERPQTVAELKEALATVN